MQMTADGHPWRDRTRWIVTVALCAPLFLLLVVAFRTWQAERRYALASETVVRDYSAIAAWQLSRRTNMLLHEQVMHAFDGASVGHQRTSAATPIASPESLLRTAQRGATQFARSALFAFTFVPGTQRLSIAGVQPEAALSVRIANRLDALARRTETDGEPHRMLVESEGKSQTAIALWLVAGPDEPTRVIYGIAGPARSLVGSLRGSMTSANMLPPIPSRSVVDAGGVHVRLTDRRGRVLLATGGPPGSTAAADSTGIQYGELIATVDLSADVGAALAGGAASSQLPSLTLMILLAALLAAAAIYQNRRSAELERLRGRFVANVSHELRTPLAQISMFAETLALDRQRTPEEGRQFASIIFSESRRLTTLVERVLRFSGMGPGTRRPAKLQPAEIVDEVQDAIDAFEPIARAAGVTITRRLEPARGLVEPAGFRQIVLNLLDNAVKHGGHGNQVTVTVARTGAEARVVVEDRGAGVPPDSRERVFEPFVRGENTSAAGAGIGLAVVRDLVREIGGTVWIEDSDHGGARFIVSLPACAAGATVVDKEPEMASH